MKRFSRYGLLLIAMVGSLMFYMATPVAGTALEDNSVDLKIDRIESKKGEQEVKGQNDETLFNDVYTSQREASIAKKAEANDALEDQLFLSDRVEEQVDDDHLFSGHYLTGVDEASANTAAEAADDHLSSFFVVIGMILLFGAIFLIYSAIKQRKGGQA